MPRLMRSTHQYCIKCAENLHDYGQKRCLGCGANLEKDESKTYDVSKIIKMRKDNYLKEMMKNCHSKL